MIKFVAICLVGAASIAGVTNVWAESIATPPVAWTSAQAGFEVRDAMMAQTGFEVWDAMMVQAGSQAGDTLAVSDTLVLSGEQTGTIEIEENVVEIVLNGVSGDGVLSLSSNTVVTLAGGTENYLGGISSTVSVEFQGGGNLTLAAGVATWDGDIVCNHTGVINVTAGTVTSVSGDIVLNSGRLLISSESEYAVSSAEGRIDINGGSFEIDGGAVAAAEVNVADTVELEGKVETLTDQEGRSARVITEDDGDIATSIVAEGPDEDNPCHIKTGTSSENNETGDGSVASRNSDEAADASAGADGLGDATDGTDGAQTMGETTGSATIIIIIIVVVVVAAVMAVVLTLAGKKRK